MAQSGYSKIQVYGSNTATNVPSAGNLTNDSNGVELGVNTADRKLYVKNSSNAVVEIANTAYQTNSATSKTTPVDADELPLADSAASYALKKLTWANLKATVKSYFDTLYVGLTGDQTVAGNKTFTGKEEFNKTPVIPGSGVDYNFKSTRDTTSLSGGTAGNVNGGVWIYSKTGASVTSYEWNCLMQTDNYSSAGENVGAYAQGNRFGTGPTWGFVAEANSLLADNNATIGMEVDCCVTGTDSTSSNRVGVDVVVADARVARGLSASANAIASYGLRIGAASGQSQSKWTTGLSVSGVSGYCVDLSANTLSNTAIKLNANQYIQNGAIYAGTSTFPTIGGQPALTAGYFRARDVKYVSCGFDQGAQTDVNLGTILVNNRLSSGGSSGAILFTKNEYVFVGSIVNDGSSVYFYNPSDYRLKNIVGSITGAADKIKAINPVQFIWKDSPEKGIRDGFIAHELQAVVPQAVDGAKDAVLSDGKIKPQMVHDTYLIPILTAALKEALLKIDSLESRIAKLGG